MACYNCSHLVVENTKNGSINGCLYYCTKTKKYVNGASDSCDSFTRENRPSYINNEIYNNGKHYYNGNISISIKVIFIIVLVILALIANI